MASNNGDNKSGGVHDPAIGMMVLFCVLAGGAWLLWHFQHEAISRGIMWFKYPQAWLLSQLSSSYSLHFSFVRDGDPAAVTGDQLYALLRDIGSVFRWPVAMLLAGFACWSLFKPLDRQFRRNFTLEGLMAEQAKVFPTVLPAVVENPMVDKSGRWARPLKEREWLKARNVVCLDEAGRQNHEKGRPDRESVRDAFVEDLGPYWRGVTELPPHLRALVAAFSLKAARQRGQYQVVVDSLARVWAKAGYKRGMDKALEDNATIMKHVDEVILAHTGFGGAADNVGYGHAFVASALPEILEWARRGGGVVACADFVWLRVANRPVWYALQNTGRDTSFPEGAAATAHWRAEKVAGRPLFEPALEQAVVGLLEGLGYDPWGYDEDEEEDLPAAADGG